jgi:hypothetical protein
MCKVAAIIVHHAPKLNSSENFHCGLTAYTKFNCNPCMRGKKHFPIMLSMYAVYAIKYIIILYENDGISSLQIAQEKVSWYSYLVV